MKYNCLRCGKEFESCSLTRKYCSVACGQRKLEGSCLDCGKAVRSILVRCEDCRKKISDGWPERLKLLRRKKANEIGRQPRGRWQHLKKFLRQDLVPSSDPLWSVNFYKALVQDAVCEYCLGPLSPTGHALDRKNSEFGHEAWNVVPCCRECNTIKGKHWEYEHMMLIAPKLRRIRSMPDSSNEKAQVS
jgi:5-methylcytosine-specific restriction endonuclease McrA